MMGRRGSEKKKISAKLRFRYFEAKFYTSRQKISSG